MRIVVLLIYRASGCRKRLLILFAVALTSIAAVAQDNRIRVTGTIKNLLGDPVPDASVIVKGRNAGTTSKADGTFSLNMPGNAVLIISHAQYKRVEVAVRNKTQLFITLDSTISDMDEVVVVGYGQLKKSDVTGAISKLDLDKEMDNRFLSVTEALQGRMAGVQIINNTGEPGGGVTFNIRGKTSVTGDNQPLIVIDGQPVESSYGSTKAGMGVDGGLDISAANPLASLNPNDIASVDVLKDASSTAIYGSRGANGVVLITTKSGRAGNNGRDKLTYTTRFDLSSLPRQIKMLGARDFMTYKNEANLNDGKDSVYTQHVMDSMLATGISMNWQDAIYETALSQDHQISLSGRDGRNDYLVSGNYSDQRGIIKNAQYKRYGFRANFSRQVNDKLKISIKNYFSMADRYYGQQSNWTGIMGSSAVMGALVTNPLQEPFEADGDLDETFANNPVLVTTLVKDKTQIRTLISNLSVDYEITKGLKYTLRAGLNDMYSLRNVYYPRGTFVGNTAPNGYATRADNSNTNYLADHLFTYRKVLDQKHSLNIVAGYSYQRWVNKSTSVTNMNFPSDQMTYYNFNSALSPGRFLTNGPRNKVLQSFLGRVNYTYDQRYVMMLTGRADGSSRLAPGNKWNFFPAVGLGWNTSNEAFFEQWKKVVSTLKFRASYGVSGNENVAIGATQAKYGIDYVVLGSGIAPGYVLSDFQNPNLGWENTKQLNIGMDLSFLKDRLSFSIDYYKKNTTDLLINLALPSSSGYSDMFTNIGEVLNKGVDVEASYNVFNKGPLTWNISANFSKYSNKVLDMGSLGITYGRVYVVAGAIILSQPLQVAKVGYPISSFWGYKTDGIYQTQEEVDAGPEKGKAKPGMTRFVDVNGDGQITEDDKTIIGNPAPDFTYGMSHEFTYKNFSFGFNIIGSKGNQLINLNQWMVGANNTSGNFNATQEAWDQRWTGPGTSNRYTRPTNNTIRFSQRFPDWMVEDASFLRIQTVRLGYAFNLKKKAPIQGLRVFVSATNLYTFTNYSWYDPNINAFDSDALGSGMDYGTLPLPRTFSAGLELGL